MMTETRPLTLRQLPLPAKLVITTFLISVGIGYFSAMVQLHFQHASQGEAMPTVDDVIEKFSGLKRYDPGAGPQQSRLQLILSGTPDGAFDKTSMVPAFFDKSAGYDKEVINRGEKVVFAERTGEWKLMQAWLAADLATQRASYDADAFVLTETQATQPISEDYFAKEARALKIRTLIEDRCVRCHNGEKKPDLDSFAHLEPLVSVPKMEVIDGKWIRSSRQTSLQGLTQSTHAHLLSFSMLFGLTGLAFAFTSYPIVMRVFLGPLVLIAQIADISCWWLARLDSVGPYFAMSIVITGGIVGMGLAAQIILTLWNLYDTRGKAIIIGLFIAGAVSFAVLYTQIIAPHLQAQKQAAAKKSTE